MSESNTSTGKENIVSILVDVLDNRFERLDPQYGLWFWVNTVEGLVAAKFVKEGYLDFDTVYNEIENSWSRLLEHWFSTNLGTDIGFSSLAEIESDLTLDKLEGLGLIQAQ